MIVVWQIAALAIGGIFILIVLGIAGLFLFSKDKSASSHSLPTPERKKNTQEAAPIFEGQTFDAANSKKDFKPTARRLDAGQTATKNSVFTNDDDDFSITGGGN